MGPTVVNGLPAHVLLVHIVVVLVPLTALAVVVCALWRRGARRIGLLLPALGLVTLASVPLTTHAGEWLAQHVGRDPLVRRHAELGDGMLPWAAGLFLVCALVWWLARRSSPVAEGPAAEGRPVSDSTWAAAVPVRAAAVVLAAAVAAGAVVQVYRIGDSGAQAAWHDGFSNSGTAQGG